MERKDFYIVFHQKKRWITYEEIHQIRKDIFIYYDDNIRETTSVLMPKYVYKMEYWKYLSINYEKEYAESEKYKKTIEYGCLALLNGIILEILDGSDEWKDSADKMLPYVRDYFPKSEKLKQAKKHILKGLDIINNNNKESYIEEAKWFRENIVKSYYLAMSSK